MRTVDEHRGAILAAVARSVAGSVAGSGANASFVTSVSIDAAHGLVLAQPAVALVDLPGFDNSSMDGYAVVSSSLDGVGDSSPRSLTLIGDSAAGRPFVGPAVGAGEAVRIMTGAPMPDGADAVIAIEETDGAASGVVQCRAGVSAGQFVRRRGEDVRVGDPVGHAGKVLGPRDLAVLAASGHGSVQVHRRVRVAVLATGDELVAPGDSLAAGQIHDSNSVMLAACVRSLGAEALVVRVVGDSEDALLTALGEVVVQADVVVTSGGVSMGAHDVVKAALRDRGVEFVQVAMQPGKPQGFGFLPAPDGRSVPVFGLPGNPVSSYVSFHVFVRPALLALMGRADTREWFPVRIDEGRLRSPQGREQYARAVLTRVDGEWLARPVEGQGSHVLGDLALANGLLRVPADVVELTEGDRADAVLLSETMPA